MCPKQYGSLFEENVLQFGDVRFELARRDPSTGADGCGNARGLSGHHGFLQEPGIGIPVSGNRLASHEQVVDDLRHEAPVGNIVRPAVFGVNNSLIGYGFRTRHVFGAGGKRALADDVLEFPGFGDVRLSAGRSRP